MTYEQLVQLFNDGDKYIRYVAKRFMVPLSLDLIAVEQDLAPGSFHRLFAEFPEYEEKFKLIVAEEDDNAKDLFLRQSHMGALQKLVGIIEESNPNTENKDLIQACKAVLSYRPSEKKGVPPSAIDSIFADLIKEGDG